MKFYFFHLMPWPDLPEDFPKRYPSAWVTVPNELFSPERATDVYRRYIDELVSAEDLGFDGICVNEHHQTAYGLMPAPNIIASMLVQRTRNIQIVLLGNALPLRDHPLRVAEEVAMLDVISGGRIISGFVRGTGAEYHSFGLNPTVSRERMVEAHDLVVKAWTEPGPFRWEGKHYQFRHVNLWPRPLQQPHPPIWLPSQGSKHTLEWVAEKRYVYCQTYSSYEALSRSFNGLYEAAESKFGYRASPHQLAWAVPIYVGETEARAHEEAKKHLLYLFHYLSHRPIDVYFPTGYVSVSDRLRMLEDKYARISMTFEELEQKGYFIVGDAEGVRQRLEEISKKLGFARLIPFLHFGSLPHDMTLANLERFAKGVMPALRPLHEPETTPETA